LKYLFLDIDGVLNNYPWYEKMYKENPPSIRNNMTPEERALIDFDPANVAQLERIVVSQPDLWIIISSSWRRLHSLAEIRGYIINKGGIEAGKRVKDKTTHQPALFKIRGQEINHWLENYSDEPHPYVILDDDSDMLPEQKAGHFVQTHYLGGLTPELADEAIKILG
jgi:hypothetical protein